MNRILAGAAAMAMIASAADLRAPTRGFVVAGEPASLRAIVGIAGAALLGDALTGTDPVSVAPGGAYAVTQGGMIFASGDRRELDGVRVAEGAFAFSPSGSSLAFRDGRTIRVFTDLPDRPRELASRSLREPFDHVTGLAISDSGADMAVMAGAEVVLLPLAGDPRSIAGLGAVSAFAFVPGGRAAVAFDSASRVVTIDDVTVGGPRAIAQAEAQWEAPDRIAISLDGGTALFTFGRRVAQVNLEAGTIVSSEMARPAVRALAMGKSQFAVSSADEQGVWMIGDFAEPAYIPAAGSQLPLASGEQPRGAQPSH